MRELPSVLLRGAQLVENDLAKVRVAGSLNEKNFIDIKMRELPSVLLRGAQLVKHDLAKVGVAGSFKRKELH